MNEKLFGRKLKEIFWKKRKCDPIFSKRYQESSRIDHVRTCGTTFFQVIGCCGFASIFSSKSQDCHWQKNYWKNMEIYGQGMCKVPLNQDILFSRNIWHIYCKCHKTETWNIYDISSQKLRENKFTWMVIFFWKRNSGLLYEKQFF